MDLFGRTHAAPKKFFDGTHRGIAPAETVARYAELMGPLGITRLADVTGLDCVGVPVVVAIRPNAKSLTVAQGKGTDRDAARASALMESIEFWHAENIDAPLRFESHRSLLKAAATVDVDAVELQIGRRIPRDTRLLWIEGFDLVRRVPTWVPYDIVSFDSVSPLSFAPRLQADSNGLASGNSMLEALEHAICELVERDASTLWFAAGDDRTGKSTQLVLDSIDVDFITRARARLADAGLLIGIYDITSDVGVPAYQCIVSDAPGNARPRGYFWGFGCHLAPSVAVTRAVTEAVQSRLSEITGLRDDIRHGAYERGRDDVELRAIQHDLEVPPPRRAFGSRASLAGESFEADVDRLVAALRGAGITSLVAVDLTKPDIGVPVVKVIAPELEGFPFGHRLGRRAHAAIAASRDPAAGAPR